MNDLLSFSPDTTSSARSDRFPAKPATSGGSHDSFSSLASSKPATTKLSLLDQLKDRNRSIGQSAGSGAQVRPADSAFWDSLEQKSAVPAVNDDPFDIVSIASANPGPHNISSRVQADDDDLLGILGKPVQVARAAPTATIRDIQLTEGNAVPAKKTSNDRALTELMDMGFPAEKAEEALQATSGDTQAAVGWLLNQAHQRSKAKTQGHNGEASGSRQRSQDGRPSDRNDRGRSPATRLPASAEEISAKANQVGAMFLKQANSLWSTGRKQVQKAVKDFQHDGETAVPKWMKDTKVDDAGPTRRQGIVTPQPVSSRTQRPHDLPSPGSQTGILTDEAMMLDMPAAQPLRRSSPASHQELPIRTSQNEASRRESRLAKDASVIQDRPPRPSSASSAPRWMQDHQSQATTRPKTKLSRQAIEDECEQAYISPARRKKAPATSTTTQPPARTSVPTTDLLSFSERQAAHLQAPNRTASAPQSRTPSTHPSRSIPNPSTKPQPTRTSPPPRSIPPVASQALSICSRHRAQGTEAFKRGDYASAHASYSSALTAIPSAHPLAIVILSNRSLSSLKTGDPKAALSDATQALTLIGTSRGDGESISLDDTSKPMKLFWEKALTRKAEALEQLELYAEAGQAWREALEAGVGGSVAARGRQRCEKATTATSSKTPHTAPPPKKKPPSPPGAFRRAAAPSEAEAGALARLRAANSAQSQAEQQRFTLAEPVAQRLAAWSSGKESNLRALLSSLDTVLWAGSGWKRVGLEELLVPARVRAVYLRAVARVHPDKLPEGVGVEKRMLAEGVFDVLRRAWEAFRGDNGL